MSVKRLPVDEVILNSSSIVMAKSAVLNNGNIELIIEGIPVTGTTVKFTAPCDCEDVTGGLVIGGVTYTLVDALGNNIAGTGGYWAANAIISALMNIEATSAFVENAAITSIETRVGTLETTLNSLINGEAVQY